MDLTTWATLLAAMRVLIGLGPIVAAAPVSKLIGFPAEHDNATARLMARWFGVRDAGLGALVLMFVHEPAALRKVFWLNLATDLADAAMLAIPLVRRQGIDRAALVSLVFALGGATAWIVSLTVFSP